MRLLFLWLLLVASHYFTNSQGNHVPLYDSLILQIPEKAIGKIGKTQENVITEIESFNAKFLKELENKEKKLFKALSKYQPINIDSQVNKIGADYNIYKQKLDRLSIESQSVYIPRLDSVATMAGYFKYINLHPNASSRIEQNLDQIKAGLAKTHSINNFITERTAQIQSLCKKYATLPNPIKTKYLNYSKEVFYYKERVANWKEELNQPGKWEALALDVLNKIPAFKTFWQQNSELAKLFGSPAGQVASLASLQTRETVMQELQLRIGSEGLNPQQLIQKNLASSKIELNKLKEKVNELKEGSIGNGDAEMPDFKPNNQNNKSFLKRLEFGWNLQTSSNPVQNINEFPSTIDFGLSTGYKLNDRLVIGSGIAYKFGLGSDWKHISYSHEGIAFRSFLDYKISSPHNGIKALLSNWWISGGFEMNYRTTIKKIEQLENISAWQKSGLLGVSKKISTNSKLFKQAKMQVLWDFLSYYQVPRTNALIFRMGYNF